MPWCISPRSRGDAGSTLDLDALRSRWGVAFRRWSTSSPPATIYMEDLHRSGGLPAVLREIAEHLDLDAPTVSGSTLGNGLAAKVGGARLTDSDPVGEGSGRVRTAVWQRCAVTSRRVAP